MPIYGYGLIKAPWELVTNISIKELADLIKIFNKCLHESKYRNDQSFTRSISLNISMDQPIIASYDYSKTGINLATYQIQLEELIHEANKYLADKNKYPKYKFDITGTWVIGNIILMKKK